MQCCGLAIVNQNITKVFVSLLTSGLLWDSKIKTKFSYAPISCSLILVRGQEIIRTFIDKTTINN